MSPIIITIGGNIGCGKSTIIEELNTYFKDTCTIIPEPIDEWGSWLDLFYTDPSKHAFGFQMKVLHSFLKNMRQVNNIAITERSPIDSLQVFCKVSYQDNIMNHLEYNLFKEYVDDIGWKPNVYIYLHTNPEVCIERIKRRGRGCETGLNEQYIHKLHQQYENMEVGCKHHMVDANQEKDQVFYEVYEIIASILDLDRINN